MTWKLYAESMAARDFILANYPPAHQWEADPVEYACWYISHGFLATCRRDDGSIAGLATGRPVETPGDGAVPYRFDDAGKTLWIDLLLIKDAPLAIPAFSYMMRHRFGDMEKIAYFRRNDQGMKVKNYARFMRNLDRKGRNYVESISAHTA